MGKGDTPRPVNKKQLDMNYLRIFAFCSEHNCPHNWACFRYCEGVGKNNKTYVPKPDDYDTCEFYNTARCEECKGRNWNQDYDSIQKKHLKTTCLICGGTGQIDYHNFKRRNDDI